MCDRRRTWLISALLLIPAPTALAQHTSYDPEYVVTNWQTEDGLPENSATAIVQSPDGYLWFGTFKGLVRFDGSKFTVYDQTNTKELPAAGIVNLHIDRAGRLWVSTTAGVAYQLDGVWHAVGRDRGFVGDYVRWFAEARDGRLYVSTFDGNVLAFVGDRFERLPDPRPGNTDAYFVHLDPRERPCVLQTGFAACWDGARWESEPLPGPLRLGGADGWLQPRDGGLVAVGGRTLRRLTAGREVFRRELDTAVAGFWSLSEDSRGDLWWASYSDGLYRIGRDGRTRRFSVATGFPADHARCVFEDRQANLWVGTNGGGLVRLRPRRFASFGPEQGLPSSGYKSVAIDRDGTVAVATYGYGLHEIRDGRPRLARVPERLEYPQTVLVGHGGELWVGTYRSGLWVSRDGRFSQLVTGPQSIAALFEDRRGQVWAGAPGGALVVDGAGPPRAVPLLPAADEIRAFAESPDGTLWAAGAHGLYRLDGEAFRNVPGPDAPGGLEILSLHADADGRLWVGSSTRGLWLRSGESWVDVGARSGLPPLAIAGLREQDGWLWAATNRGIWRTEKARLIAAASTPGTQVAWQSFGKSDGLPSIECSSTAAPAIAADGAGRLWFCTLKGLAVVDPARLQAAAADMPLHLERFSFTDAASRPRELGGPALREIAAPAGSREFGIFFTAIDLTSPEKVLFESRLEKEGRTVASTVSGRREAHLPTLEPGDYGFSLRARNGDGVWSRERVELRFRVLPFYWQTHWFRIGGALLAAIAAALVTRRVTLSRARRAQQLSALQARLALVLQNTNDAVTFTAPDDTVTYMNEAAARLLGRAGTGAGPLRAENAYPPWAWELVRGPAMDAVRRTGSWQGESAFRHADGREIPVWQLLVAHRGPDGSIEFVSSIARDMTELKRMEEQVRQAQKMESVGLLAGGVAHDFNNLLQVIQAHIELARRRSVKPAQLDAHLRNVSEAADRAARLTRQLLAFGRRQPLKLELTDLADLVAQHLRMLGRVIGEQIDVRFAAAARLGLVRCDRTQIEQVLLNLCVNARDAMPRGGRLTVALEDLTIDAAYVAANPWARAGHFVVLSVADTGCGMDRATRERIFEPFFSTKATGTGLGLSVVYGIVQQHAGMLHVYSEPGSGTTFKAYLPVVDEGAALPLVEEAASPPGGHETILLVEDDPGVAAVTRSLLESAGYTVLAAADGADAVRLFLERGDEVDLLLLDLALPGIGGREAREEMRRRRPGVPALFCSGYDPLYGQAALGQEPCRDPVIEKPYSPSALLRRIREVLDSATR